MRRLLLRLHVRQPVAVYVDLHGHSRKQRVFMYGCEEPGSVRGATLSGQEQGGTDSAALLCSRTSGAKTRPGRVCAGWYGSHNADCGQPAETNEAQTTKPARCA